MYGTGQDTWLEKQIIDVTQNNLLRKFPEQDKPMAR